MIFSALTPISEEINLTIPSLCLLKIFASLLRCCSKWSFTALESRTGLRWCSLLGSNFSRSELRWMAKLGIFNRGCPERHNLEVYFPYSSQTTLPATMRSRSNQVCHRPPPQVETWHWSIPRLDALETGFNLRQGLSVCVPMILKPVSSGLKSFPTSKATTVVKFLVKKYFLPACSCQLSISFSSMKPCSVRCLLNHSTAWQGETAWLTKEMKEFASQRLRERRVYILIEISLYLQMGVPGQKGTIRKKNYYFGQNVKGRAFLNNLDNKFLNFNVCGLYKQANKNYYFSYQLCLRRTSPSKNSSARQSQPRAISIPPSRGAHTPKPLAIPARRK